METSPKPTNLPYDDFAKLDLRAGTVTKAEAVAKSKKLLRLEVSFGSESRVILAGVAENYSPEMILGNQVLAVLNLAPRTMMGIESHGMLLAGRRENGSLSLALCPGVPDGGDIG